MNTVILDIAGERMMLELTKRQTSKLIRQVQNKSFVEVPVAGTDKHLIPVKQIRSITVTKKS